MVHRLQFFLEAVHQQLEVINFIIPHFDHI